MITDTATKAIKEYLDSKRLNRTAYTPRGVDNLTYPCILITDTGTDEHEVLDGVYNVSIEVAYVSTPNTDGNAGETGETITNMSKTIYDSLTCRYMIDFLNTSEGFKVFDINSIQVSSDDREGRSATVYSLEIVCCEV